MLWGTWAKFRPSHCFFVFFFFFLSWAELHGGVKEPVAVPDRLCLHYYQIKVSFWATAGEEIGQFGVTSCKLSEKTPRLQSDIEQISTGSLTRLQRRAMATPLLLPALPTEFSLCWFVFHKSNADILLSANCRLIHGWRCTETQEDFNDFNDVFWLSQLRCREKNPKEPQTEKPPLCLSGHGESRSLSRQKPSTGNAAIYGTEWFEAHRRWWENDVKQKDAKQRTLKFDELWCESEFYITTTLR